MMKVTQDLEARDVEPASELSRRLNLPFSNLSLLTRALTHSSFVNENPTVSEDNERLEFLGDAVLDFIVLAALVPTASSVRPARSRRSCTKNPHWA